MWLVAAVALALAGGASSATAPSSSEFNWAIPTGVLSELKLQLAAPWATLNFDAAMIESGAALADNNSRIDFDAGSSVCRRDNGSVLDRLARVLRAMKPLMEKQGLANSRIAVNGHCNFSEPGLQS